jgi:4-amino-4-deoxy-L-arabinose transferase-like glycosyltransferase
MSLKKQFLELFICPFILASAAAGARRKKSMLFQPQPSHRAILIAFVAGAVVAFFGWLCLDDPHIAFLPGDKRADWILYPFVSQTGMYPMGPVEVLFRREFSLDERPGTAPLAVRANQRVKLLINGRPANINQGSNWKDFSRADVAGYLRAGTNTIEARVANDDGPPALWLALATDRLVLRSDAHWQTSFAGSPWHSAILATTPRMPGWRTPIAGNERTFSALAGVWPMWMIFTGLSLAAWVGGQAWLGGRPRPEATLVSRFLRHDLTLPLIFVVLLWVALFCHNTRLLPKNYGFDASAHLEYIRYLQNHWALPLPDFGWETFQPPLYYGVSAILLSTLGLTVADVASGTVLRGLAMFLGVAQFILIFLILRRLFPGQLGRPLVGLALAAFLPMNLYMAHYVTNEMLAATLATTALWLCFRLLPMEKMPATGCALLGLSLGLGLLAKITCALLVPFTVVALAGKLIAQRSAPAVWWRTLGLMLAVFLAVCGWYYAWIWLHCGSPFVGNWDANSRFHLWQDNGYHTAGDFTRFGRSLVNPLFSGFNGFADGIYSTLWGDGLCGGSDGGVTSPPWNYDLMGAGYFLALLPTALVLLGATASVWHFIRRPTAPLFVLLGFAGTVGLALVFMNLKVPFYSEAKAFYGASALMPFCFFGAVGWEVLARGRKSLQFVLGIILLVWIMNSFTTFWIRAN